jgi:type IX secretion system PorP/SprF family membrane protein
MDGTFRAGTIYRNQWNSVSVPFESTGLYADFKSYPKFLNGKVIGLGVQLLNDRSGSGGLVENVLTFSGSYHHFLSTNKDQLLIAGLSLGLFQKSVDLSKLNFENQFLYETANFGSISSNENFENNSITRPDIGLGLAWTWFNPYGYQITAGLSAAHINLPNQSFYGNDDELSPRINFHANAIYSLNKQIDIDPSMLIMRQNGNTNTVIGVDLLYGLGRKTVEKIDLKLGIYGRLGDAMSFTVGMNHDNWSIDVAYDLNVSSLIPASEARGAFEISISYVNRMYKGIKDKKYLVPATRLL